VIPTVGRIVHYRLALRDIDRAHLAAKAAWAQGARGRHQSQPGDVVPLLVVRVWPDEYAYVEAGHGSVVNPDDGGPLAVESPVGLNGQAFLDGDVAVWVTSASHGPGPGQWSWPPRV